MGRAICDRVRFNAVLKPANFEQVRDSFKQEFSCYTEIKTNLIQKQFKK